MSGIDWKSLIDLVGPSIGLLQGHEGGRSGFAAGWRDAEQRAKQEQLRTQQLATQRGDAALRYSTDVAAHLDSLDDPADFEHHRAFAKQAGAKAGLDTSALDTLVFRDSKRGDALVRELSNQLDQLEKNGYNLDDLAASGAGIELKAGGLPVPVGAALNLTRRRPQLSGGNVPKPPANKRGYGKLDVLFKGETEPREINYDPDTGKYSDPDTGAIIPSTSFKKYEKPAAAHDVDPSSARGYYGDLVEVWKAKPGNEGKEPPAEIRMQLKELARKKVGQADDKPGKPAPAPGTLDPRLQAQALGVGRAFDQLPIVRSTQKMSEAVGFAQGMNPQTKNPADDQALIYAFAKAMDPDSVVREGEYATVQKYAQSWLQSFGFNAQRILSNTEFLTPEARANMKKTILQKFEAARKQYAAVRKSSVEKINKITGGSDGETWLTDYGAAFPEPAAVPAARPGGAGAGLTYQDYLNSRGPK